MHQMQISPLGVVGQTEKEHVTTSSLEGHSTISLREKEVNQRGKPNQFSGRSEQIFPAYPRAGPNLPNYKYPELCPLSSHMCEQIWKGSHPRKVISLSEEETASVTEPRRPSVRKSESMLGGLAQADSKLALVVAGALTRQWYNHRHHLSRGAPKEESLEENSVSFQSWLGMQDLVVGLAGRIQEQRRALPST